MWRPTPHRSLAAAVSVLAASCVALTAYLFGGPTSSLSSPKPLALLLLPALAGVLVLQAVPYPSLSRRLVASALALAAGLLFTVVAVFLLGCGFYGACSK
jgi:hypothetical protein